MRKRVEIFARFESHSTARRSGITLFLKQIDQLDYGEAVEPVTFFLGLCSLRQCCKVALGLGCKRAAGDKQGD